MEKEFYLTPADARQILGIDSALFQQWMNREIIPFETVRQGKRTWRRIKGTDLDFLTIVTALCKLHIHIGLAADLAEGIISTVRSGEYSKGSDCVIYANDRFMFVSQREKQKALEQLNACAYLELDAELLGREILQNKKAAEKLVAARAGESKE